MGCPATPGSSGDEQSDYRQNKTVQSRDEVITVTLPADLHMHRHLAGIQAASADGRFRVHVEHGPDDLLMRLVGHAKEVLSKRDWDVILEKHYAHAVELRLKTGGVSGKDPEARTIWWVKANERVLTCDGIAHADVAARVGAPFRALCQGVEMSPPLPPPAAASDAGPSSDGGAGADASGRGNSGRRSPGAAAPGPNTPSGGGLGP